jgi:hypothetical protein
VLDVSTTTEQVARERAMIRETEAAALTVSLTAWASAAVRLRPPVAVKTTVTDSAWACAVTRVVLGVSTATVELALTRTIALTVDASPCASIVELARARKSARAGLR